MIPASQGGSQPGGGPAAVIAIEPTAAQNSGPARNGHEISHGGPFASHQGLMTHPAACPSTRRGWGSGPWPSTHPSGPPADSPPVRSHRPTLPSLAPPRGPCGATTTAYYSSKASKSRSRLGQRMPILVRRGRHEARRLAPGRRRLRDRGHQTGRPGRQRDAALRRLPGPEARHGDRDRGPGLNEPGVAVRREVRQIIGRSHLPGQTGTDRIHRHAATCRFNRIAPREPPPGRPDMAGPLAAGPLVGGTRVVPRHDIHSDNPRASDKRCHRRATKPSRRGSPDAPAAPAKSPAVRPDRSGE